MLETKKTPTPYWQKQSEPLFSNLEWNIPERPAGSAAILGGNSQNFANIIKTAEYLGATFPLASLNVLLPDALAGQVPRLDHLHFAPSTPSGSFASSPHLAETIDTADASLLLGDFSKNSLTASALASALLATEKPVILTRDTIDLLLPEAANLLVAPVADQLILLASLAQLQKLLRAIYYPKLLLLSMPLLPVVELLHKFTLSYPLTLLTFHEGEILSAHAGSVISTPITKTTYSPLSLWQGRLAANLLGLLLYNPGQPLACATHAPLYH